MSRRDALAGIGFPGVARSHRGLWLDKYIRSVAREDTASRYDLVREVTGRGEGQEYRDFFARYCDALRDVGAERRKARTLSRTVVGLGGEGVLETSITLHRTYGVPYIPGSALKGLASRYAHLYLEGESWRRNLAGFRRGEAQATVFGTTGEQGILAFFDALPVPGSWELHADILNPHHPQYYREENVPPADWDSPLPVPFVSTTGTFLVALAPAPGVPRESAAPWLQATWEILERALREEGVGAKTSSGYGRMKLEPAGAGASQSKSAANGAP